MLNNVFKADPDSFSHNVSPNEINSAFTGCIFHIFTEFSKFWYINGLQIAYFVCISVILVYWLMSHRLVYHLSEE